MSCPLEMLPVVPPLHGGEFSRIRNWRVDGQSAPVLDAYGLGAGLLTETKRELTQVKRYSLQLSVGVALFSMTNKVLSGLYSRPHG